MPVCYIHNERVVSRELLEEHHKHPRAYGGPDTPDNLVLLCPSCHSMVHQAAIKLYHGKIGVARDLISQYIPDSPIRKQRLWTLVQSVVKAKKQHVRSVDIPEAGETEEAEDDLVMVTVHLPSWVHHRLKTFSLGVGLEKYIVSLLAKHCIVKSSMPGAESSEMLGISVQQNTPKNIKLLRS